MNKKNLRRNGNWIIVGTKKGNESYYNWYEDSLVAEKANASGYHTKHQAMMAVSIMRTEDKYAGYVFSSIEDKQEQVQG